MMTRILWFIAILAFIAAFFMFTAARGAMHETTAAVVGVGAIIAAAGAAIHGVLKDILIATRGQYQPPTPEEIADQRKMALLLVAAIAVLVVTYLVIA